ncbi:MAG: phosphomannomutase, partial [Proteobacteria bacterium]|nr:phosphomannomutase [Pseudomonadota bacterium]
LSTGLDVIDLGIVPTPLLYFYLFQHRTAGGVVVTGSHNAPQFNGFKICRGAQTLYDREIQEILKTVQDRAFFHSAKPGSHKVFDPIPSYLDYVGQQFQPLQSTGPMKRPIKIVVDAGNGTAALVAPDLLRGLGCDVVGLYCEPDGRFPHHHPDPTVPANLTDLQSVVREKQADLGVAYDGDADRLGVVDERGEIVFGDRLLILYARQVLKEKAGGICIGDVKCSQLFFDEVRLRGGTPLMWRTGHSLIKAKMRETGAVLAGEMSGHFFFADRYYGFDDALYATCRLLEVLDAARKDDPDVRLSDLLGDLPDRVTTPEIRIFCPDEHKHAIVHRLAEKIPALLKSGAIPAEIREEVEKVDTLDGLRLVGKHGWGLIRASNTEPALILRFEAASEALMGGYRSFIEGLLAQILAEMRIEN